MKNVDEDLLQYIVEAKLADSALVGNYGLEKENVRVDEAGRLALTPHPKVFGDKLHNPYIKTDFSESQVEVVTPVCESLEEAYYFLENLHDIVATSLEGEYLWPQSNPPVLPEDEAIPIAVYEDEGRQQREYRERLAQKYGCKKQLLSGIHFNFSFNQEFCRKLHKKFGANQSYKDFKDDLYLKVTRNFLKHRWFLIYLTGASSTFHNTFFDKGLIEVSEELTSLRNSKCGYKNDEDFIVNYDSLAGFINSIQELIDAGKIECPSEFYNPIRLKGEPKGNMEQLKDLGIRYLEIRIFDLNPFNKNGIFLEDLALTNLFMLYMLLRSDSTFNARQQELANENHNRSTSSGRHPGATLYQETGELVSFKEAALEIVEELEALVKTLDFNVEYLLTITNAARQKFLDPQQTYSYRVIEEVKCKSYIGFHLQGAKAYLEESKSNFNLKGYEDLELSTQILIKDAIKKGIKFEVVDRRESFIRLQTGSRIEYVKQATKTSKDSYSTVLIMENKVVTKLVLEEQGLEVPASESFTSMEQAMLSYARFKDSQIVIKPKSTNFGLGISIFKEPFSQEELQEALRIAFLCDSTVLIEEFVMGEEYRFLVIDNRVVAVLRRMPANVRGDGISTISELVEKKNQDPLRGLGHKTPLEKIQLGDIEQLFLKTQGKHVHYIPRPDEIVFLRENSNISTGGDSIDYTDRMHESYKAIAIQAAKAVGAAITGVDIIIKDVDSPCSEDNYAVIELNFNPAIHMHCYPYRGENRKVGEEVLDLLFKELH